ncbi:MAG: hypothetical protein HC875_31915, partial [Anaerolineales bacterium]|nr:hypothetical protein [Anaerolineales bacterium]
TEVNGAKTGYLQKAVSDNGVSAGQLVEIKKLFKKLATLRKKELLHSNFDLATTAGPASIVQPPQSPG